MLEWAKLGSLYEKQIRRVVKTGFLLRLVHKDRSAGEPHQLDRIGGGPQSPRREGLQEIEHNPAQTQKTFEKGVQDRGLDNELKTTPPPPPHRFPPRENSQIEYQVHRTWGVSLGSHTLCQNQISNDVPHYPWKQPGSPTHNNPTSCNVRTSRSENQQKNSRLETETVRRESQSDSHQWSSDSNWAVTNIRGRESLRRVSDTN